MTIKNITIQNYNVKLSSPFEYFTAKLDYLPYALINITTNNGLIGYGEAALAWDVTGETQSGAKAIFPYIKSVILGKKIEGLSDIKNLMTEISLGIHSNTALKSGVEMALLDLLGKKENLPVYKLFGAENNKGFVAQKVLSYAEEDESKIYKKIDSAKKIGVKIIKIKIGQDSKKNLGLIEKIFKYDSSMMLVLDVNQGWKDAKTALPIIKKIEKFNIAWIEQPTHADKIADLALIKKKSKLKIMADESCHNLVDLKALHANNCVNLINIKIAKTGGFFEALEMIKYCETNSIQYMLGDMIYSNLGTAANLHLGLLGNFVSYDLTDPKRILNNKFSGIKTDSYYFVTPDRAGLGVEIIDL